MSFEPPAPPPLPGAPLGPVPGAPVPAAQVGGYPQPQTPFGGLTPGEEAPPPTRPRRSRGKTVTIVLLAIALVLTLIALAGAAVVILTSSARIDQQRQQILEQQELLEKKETFGAAVTSLLGTAAAFDGLRMSSLVPYESYDRLVSAAHDQRLNPVGMDAVTAEVRAADEDLQALLAAAQVEAATNASGTVFESVIDQLGSGFVRTSFDDADVVCERDVLACVSSADPFVVHVDAADIMAEHMTDWIRTGIAYHEFAHVLQMTNPVPTAAAVEAFGGDRETMADCYALTFLDGWTLDHTVWINDFQYWEVSAGYGYTCDAAQMQVIRDWNDQLVIAPRALGEGSA